MRVFLFLLVVELPFLLLYDFRANNVGVDEALAEVELLVAGPTEVLDTDVAIV